MSDWLARFDRLRAEDPAKAADLLSRIAESDWEMTFEGNPRAEPDNDSGLRRRVPWREARLDLKPSKNRHVRRFVRNPTGEMDADYTRDPAFGWDLLAYCSEYVDAIPARGQRLTRTALIVFARNERDGVRDAACMTVSAKGVLAFSDFILNNLEEATLTLRKAFESALERDCAGCQAGCLRKDAVLDRERAYLGIDPHGYSLAYDKATAAIQLYSDPLTTDHDLLGHGLANSYMTRGIILNFWHRSYAALSDLSVALHHCPRSSSRLYTQCICNTAVALLNSGKEKHMFRAAEIVFDLKKKFARTRKASTARAMTFWLDGQISGRIGATEVAIEAHEDALDDFVALKAPVNSSAVVSDLSKLTVGNPARIRDHIHRLDPERTCRCPSWIPGFLQRGLAELYRMCGSQGVNEAALMRTISDLRTSSGCKFPCLI